MRETPSVYSYEVYERLNNKYPYLTDALRSRSSETVSQILTGLDGIESQGIHSFLLERIFTIEHSAKILWDLKPNADSDSVVESDTSDLIDELTSNRGVKRLIPILWTHVFEWEDKEPPEVTKRYTTYKLGLSMLLSQIPPSEASLLVLNEIENDRYLNHRIEPTNFPWHMCEGAEEKMESALSDDISGVVLVDNVLLTKVSHGKLSSICLYPTATPSGIFVPGVWYSPTEEKLREKIKEAYSNGETRLQSEGSSWALMRGVNTYSAEGEQTPQEYLEKLRMKAENLPIFAPKRVRTADSLDLVSRSEARDKLKEEYEENSGHFPLAR